MHCPDAVKKSFIPIRKQKSVNFVQPLFYIGVNDLLVKFYFDVMENVATMILVGKNL